MPTTSWTIWSKPCGKFKRAEPYTRTLRRAPPATRLRQTGPVFLTAFLLGEGAVLYKGYGLEFIRRLDARVITELGRSDPPHPASGPADTMRKYVVRRSPAATTAARYPPRPACRAFAVFSKIHASSYSPQISRTAAARKPTDRMQSTCSPNPKSRDADSCRRFCTRWMLPYRHSLSKEMY